MCLNTALYANGAPTKIGAPLTLDLGSTYEMGHINLFADRSALTVPATTVPNPATPIPLTITLTPHEVSLLS